MWVLFTNPRGSSGTNTEFTYASRGDWGGKDYEDLMKAVDIAAKRPDVDSTRMGVTGGSYGGFMTAWVTTKTNRFKAAEADRMISEWTYWYGASDAQGLTEGEFFGKPWENQIMYDTLSPIRYVKKVKTPTLLVQSEEDYRTPIGNAELWFMALKKQGVPAEFVRYPRSNHDLSRTGEPWLLVDRLGRIRQWFGYWLKENRRQAAAERAARWKRLRVAARLTVDVAVAVLRAPGVRRPTRRSAGVVTSPRAAPSGLESLARSPRKRAMLAQLRRDRQRDIRGGRRQIVAPVLRDPHERTPAALLVAARAAAGWDGWARSRSCSRQAAVARHQFDGEGRELLARAALERERDTVAAARTRRPLMTRRLDGRVRAQCASSFSRARSSANNMFDSAARRTRAPPDQLASVRDWLLLRAAGTRARFGRARRSVCDA